MGRFMAQSLSLDRRSLRDTSIRVSALIENDLGSMRPVSLSTPNEYQRPPSHSQGLQEQQKPLPNKTFNKGRERINIFRDFYRDRIRNFGAAPAAALATVEEDVPDKRQETESERVRRGPPFFLPQKAPPKQQMQCDLCRNGIKLRQLYYACNTCDDGGRIYCKKCANKGRTCRHELVERLRDPKYNIVKKNTPPSLGYEVLPGGRIARLSALSGDEPYGVGKGNSSDDNTRVAFNSTPETKSETLSSGGKIQTTDRSGIEHGHSEQLPFFKDYYSMDDIHPGNLLSVLWAYQPRAGDEFELERGDMLQVVGLWDDGWATGVRCSTRAEDWNAASPSPQTEISVGEIKAFPLVCVCLPSVWQKTIEGDVPAPNATAEANATG